MKTLFTVMLCLVAIFNVSAQSEAEVSKAVETLKQAMISGDRKALEKIAAEELSYGHSSGLVENKAAFVENIASGKSDFVTIDLSEQTITVAGTVAIVRHKLVADTVNNGTPGKANIAVLLIWQKAKGGWKLLARQAVKV